MKKLVLTTVCALALTGAAFGQGQVTWATPSSSITAQTNGNVYSPLFGGGATGNAGSQGNTFAGSSGVVYDYALLYQPQVGGSGSGNLPTDTTVWDGTWTFSGLTANNSGFAHNVTPVGAGTVTIPAFANTNGIVLVGWSANLGSTWVTVSNVLANWSTLQGTIVGPAYFGESAFGYVQGTTSPAPGASLFASSGTAQGLPINSLNMQLFLLPVPEPATLALAGLGGLSLMLFRRQRK